MNKRQREKKEKREFLAFYEELKKGDITIRISKRKEKDNKEDVI